MVDSLITIQAEVPVKHTSITMVGQIIDEELNKIVEEATVYANWFWDNSKIYRKEDNSYARFGTRVRVNKGVFQAVWFVNTYVKNGPRQGQVLSKQLPKGANHKYPKSSFKNAHEWEYDLIIQTEEQYAKLRERYSYLSKLKRAYNVYVANAKKLKTK